MYSRNTGSNCPRSGAPITRSTRGSALIGPGPISSRCGGLTGRISSLSMRMVLEPMAGDVDASRDPHLLVLHVLDEALERRQAAGPADQAAMQADRHHAMLLRVQHVEGVLQVIEEIIARV